MKKFFLSKQLFYACRPRQWTKNLLVFAAPFFSFKIDPFLISSTLVAFILFCLLSSCIYLINDILDIEADRLHPKKSKRPIASGKVSKKAASILSFFCFIFSISLANSISFKLLLIGLIYFSIQFSYCFIFKNKAILDIFCISAGFLLRAISGAYASSLTISPWFLLSIGLLSLFLAIEKRKAELVSYKKTGIFTRKVLKDYTLSLLTRFENIVATGCFVSYSLWAAGPTLNGAPTQWMLITVPFVLIGIFRYQLLSDRELNNINYISNEKSTESPEEILLNDKGIKSIILSWLATCFAIYIIVL